MKIRKKGALTVIVSQSIEGSLEDEISEALSVARSIRDSHGPRTSLKLDEAEPEVLVADILEYSAAQISEGLSTLPAKHRSRVEVLLYAAVNFGRALASMDVHREHGRKIDGKRKSLEALAKHNKKAPITDDQRTKVGRLYDEPSNGKLSKDARYKKIAQATGLGPRRVRTIIEQRKK